MVNEARFGFLGGVVLFNPDTTIGQFTGTLANQAGFHLDLNSAAGISSVTQNHRAQPPQRAALALRRHAELDAGARTP